MLKSFYPVVLLFVLSACGAVHGCSSCDMPSAPTHIDWVGPSGLSVSFDSDVMYSLGSAEPWGKFFEKTYINTQKCVADLLGDPTYITIPGPVVRVVSSIIIIDGKPYSGWTDFTTGQVTLQSSSFVSSPQHEFVHYLLLRHGFDNAANAAHLSPAFPACGPNV